MNILTHRVRGFRLLDLIALGLLIALTLSVYLAKAIAGRERAEIAAIERRIGAEHERIRLLQAEVAHLERPERIGHLATTYLGLGPVSAKQEITPQDLASHATPRPPVAPIAESIPTTAAVPASTTAVPTAAAALAAAPTETPPQ